MTTGVGDVYRDYYAQQNGGYGQTQTPYGYPQVAGGQAAYGPGGAPQYAGYPDHYHVGYDQWQQPVYQDRYQRYHYGAQNGYRPAPPPPSYLGQTPGDAPPAAAGGAAPVVVAPPAAAPPATVVVVPPAAPAAPGAVAPWYRSALGQLQLPHPAGGALITALGAGVGAFVGMKWGGRIPYLHLSGATATAAGAAVGAGVAGGVTAMLISRTAHEQHQAITGVPAPA